MRSLLRYPPAFIHSGGPRKNISEGDWRLLPTSKRRSSNSGLRTARSFRSFQRLAQDMLKRLPGGRRLTVGADKGYDTRDFRCRLQRPECHHARGAEEEAVDHSLGVPDDMRHPDPARSRNVPDQAYSFVSHSSPGRTAPGVGVALLRVAPVCTGGGELKCCVGLGVGTETSDDR